jgi:hypothetical protein
LQAIEIAEGAGIGKELRMRKAVVFDIQKIEEDFDSMHDILLPMTG